MYRIFGKTKDRKRIIIPSIILIGFFSTPVSAFLIWVAVSSNDPISYLIALVVTLFVFLFSAAHIKNIYEFPPVQIDENFLIVSRPLQKRVAFTLDKITTVKRFINSVIIIHNGIPALLNFNSLCNEEVSEIVDLIQ